MQTWPLSSSKAFSPHPNTPTECFSSLPLPSVTPAPALAQTSSPVTGTPVQTVGLWSLLEPTVIFLVSSRKFQGVILSPPSKDPQDRAQLVSMLGKALCPVTSYLALPPPSRPQFL